MGYRRRKVHVATGAHSAALKKYLVEDQGVDEEDVVFHLAQCLAFIIQGTNARVLAKRARVTRNRFAWRKLRSTLNMLEEVFSPEEDECSP